MDLAAFDDLEGVLEARIGVVTMFGTVGNVLPADPAVLAAVWPTAPRPQVRDIASAVDALIADGAVRRIVLGAEPHLVAVPRNDAEVSRCSTMEQSAEPPPAPAPPRPVEPPVDLADERDALALAIDVEQERLVLYRVAIVVQVVLALVFLRGLL